MNDKVKSLPVAPGHIALKENQEPNSQETSSNPAPAVKETAFSRMMRAGSMLQQHKLKKRKTSGPGFRSGKLRAAHQTPLSSRIGQFAYTSNAKADSLGTSSGLVVEQQTSLNCTSEQVGEPEDARSTSNSEDEADIVSKATTSTLDQHVTDIAEVTPEIAAVIAAPAPIASFDRF